MKKSVLFIAILALITSVASAAMLMKAPSNVTVQNWRDGSSSTVDAFGNVSVANNSVSDALRAGFVPVNQETSQLTAITSGSTYTVSSGAMESADFDILSCSTQTTAVTLAPRTATQIMANRSGASASWRMRIINGNTVNGIITLSTNTGVVVSGATITVGAWRDYLATYASPTVTFTSIGAGTN